MHLLQQFSDGKLRQSEALVEFITPSHSTLNTSS